MVTDLYKLSAKGGMFTLLARQLQLAHEALDKVAAEAAAEQVRAGELAIRGEGLKTVATYTALAVSDVLNGLTQRDVFGAKGCEECGLDPAEPFYKTAMCSGGCGLNVADCVAPHRCSE